jgi:hypothetical protein
MTLANDGKLKLSWDVTHPLDRENPEWPRIEERARTFIRRRVPDADLILDILGLTTE